MPAEVLNCELVGAIFGPCLVPRFKPKDAINSVSDQDRSGVDALRVWQGLILPEVAHREGDVDLFLDDGDQPVEMRSEDLRPGAGLLEKAFQPLTSRLGGLTHPWIVGEAW